MYKSKSPTLKCYCGKYIKIGPELARHRINCAEFQRQHNYSTVGLETVKKAIDRRRRDRA